MQEDNKAEDERGIRGTMHIGEEVDVGIWCWKGNLGYGRSTTSSSSSIDMYNNDGGK